MGLKDSSRLLVVLSFVWAGLLLAIGLWWLYLIQRLGTSVNVAALGKNGGPDIAKMLVWEGGSFIVLLLLLSATLVFLYLKDIKKAKSLQAFFSSLTHELKTPMASIRLQTEVLQDVIEDDDLKDAAPSASDPVEKLRRLSGRLIEDTTKLEIQMDNILQLSRIERGGELNLDCVELEAFVKGYLHKEAKDFKWKILPHNEIDDRVYADELALDIVFRNLLSNARRYSTGDTLEIEMTRGAKETTLRFCDFGLFKGQSQSLGKLFYTHGSKKGSGIGLYLIKRLMRAMGGKASYSTSPHFQTTLSFRPYEEATSNE